MILIDETVKKFRYHPDSLAEFSRRMIICKCTRCDNVYETSKYNYARKIRKNLCTSCACHFNSSKTILTAQKKKELDRDIMESIKAGSNISVVYLSRKHNVPYKYISNRKLYLCKLESDNAN